MDQILLTIISVLFGGVIGYLTSWYFYKKSEIFEQDANQIRFHEVKHYLSCFALLTREGIYLYIMAFE